MFKNLAIAALATITMSAFAQNSMSNSDQNWNKSWSNKDQSWDWSGKSLYEMRKHVEWHADETLSGGDRFELANLLDRAPFSVENALLHGLAGARKQAFMINDRMLALRFPDTTSSTTMSTTNADGTSQITTTTWTTTDWNASNIDWSNEDKTSRAMRMAMTTPSKPRCISYDQAIDILSSNLNSTETATLQNWWFDKASERQKDVLTKLVKDDAWMADQTYYPSVYMHRTYTWANPTMDTSK